MERKVVCVVLLIRAVLAYWSLVVIAFYLRVPCLI